MAEVSMRHRANEDATGPRIGWSRIQRGTCDSVCPCNWLGATVSNLRHGGEAGIVAAPRAHDPVSSLGCRAQFRFQTAKHDSHQHSLAASAEMKSQLASRPSADGMQGTALGALMASRCPIELLFSAGAVSLSAAVACCVRSDGNNCQFAITHATEDGGILLHTIYLAPALARLAQFAKIATGVRASGWLVSSRR